MGLNLSVGVLADLSEGDPEGADLFRVELSRINFVLNQCGLPKHYEPVECPVGGFEMFGYSGLHYLRRLAAHLDLEQELPEPGNQTASEDPVLQRYYSLHLEPPPSIFSRIFRNRRSNQTKSKLRFNHLILHSDSEGYYLPIRFPDVIFPPRDIRISGSMIGSSFSIIQECKILAEALGLPLDLDPESEEIWHADESQGQGERPWERYGVESFTCLRLYHAAVHSIRHNCVIQFN